MSGVQLKARVEGRFLCIEVTNLGAPAVFTGVVQPGRGTASAAVARTALWHDTTGADRKIDTGQSAILRIAQRDRPPTEHEVDDRKQAHPEGSQAWRMWFLKKGRGAPALSGVEGLERICPVVRRDGSSEHDGVVLTLMSDPPLPGRTIVKSIELEGALAIDADTGDEFRVVDSPRHYHAKTF